MDNNKNKPQHEIRFGQFKATIWLNETDNGSRHSVTLKKAYKVDDEWKETQSFGKNDLLAVAHVAQLAATWINEQALTEAQAA